MNLMSLFSSLKNTLNRYRRNPVAIAVLLIILLTSWLCSGDWQRAKTEPTERGAAPEQETAFQVETEVLQAEYHTPEQVVQGQLESLRAVEIRSQIGAHITERLAEWGERVKRGDLLVQLDPESRAAELARAEAELRL